MTAAIPDDPDVARAIAPYAEQIHKRFGQVLAQAPNGLPKGGGPGENPLGFFVADLMREGASKAMGAEVRFALTNAGGLRRSLAPGDVTVGDIVEAIPFDNELVVAEYTGAQILAIVKESILHRGGEPCSGVRTTVRGPRASPSSPPPGPTAAPSIPRGATWRPPRTIC